MDKFLNWFEGYTNIMNSGLVNIITFAIMLGIVIGMFIEGNLK